MAVVWALLSNRHVGGGLIALALLVGAYVKGRDDCHKVWLQRQAEADLRWQQQILEVQREAEKADAEAKARHDAEIDALQKKADADARRIQDPRSVCIPPVDTDRLRSLWRTK